jgi:hypothetical protein
MFIRGPSLAISCDTSAGPPVIVRLRGRDAHVVCVVRPNRENEDEAIGLALSMLPK